MQLAEGLSDRQAAGAVGVRIERKYALCFEATDAGLDFSVLPGFRARLVEGGSERLSIEPLPEACKERGSYEARGGQRTDSPRVLGASSVLSESAGAQNGKHHASAREDFDSRVHGSPERSGTSRKRGTTVGGVISLYWSRVPDPPGEFKS